MELSNKTAVVTGASSGLGLEVTRLLSAAGVTVYGLARDFSKAELPDAVRPVVCNVRDLDSIDAAFAQIDAEVSQIDVLITCAGRALSKPFLETSRDEIMDVLGVNLKGTMYLAQEGFKRMVPHRSGYIITIGSTSSIRTRTLEVVYCASKWGVRGFTDSLRQEAREYGIKVTGVYPGGMHSPNFWRNNPERDQTGYMNPRHVAQQVVQLLAADPEVTHSEVVIERSTP